MRKAIIEVVYDRNNRAETYGKGSVEVRFFFGGNAYADFHFQVFVEKVEFEFVVQNGNDIFESESY